MKKAVITGKPTDTVEKIIQVMGQTGVGGIIIEEDSEVEGIITEGDIISEIAENGRFLEKEISEIMNKPVKTVNKKTDLEEALRIMRDMNIERLPVVENEKLVGIVTERDLIRVEPALIEMAREKEVLDSMERNERKQLRATGICERCEIHSNDLREFQGEMLCRDCREERV